MIPPDLKEERGLRRRVIALIGADRVVLFSLLNQVQGALMAPLSLFLVAHYLTAVEQGYYFAFTSAQSIQVLVELGFTICILQLFSHESANLSWSSDRTLRGPPLALSRMRAILGFALHWYAAAGTILFLVLWAAGEYLFGQKAGGPQWRGAWLIICASAAGSLAAQPVLSMVEGTHRRDWAVCMRLTLSFTRTLLICAGLYAGVRLYSLSAGVFVYALGTIIIPLGHWKAVLRQLHAQPMGDSPVKWRTDIWPFQWRIATSWICGYLIFSALNPLIFKMRGPIESGRFGMTWALFQAVSSFGGAWVNTRAPLFGAMVARAELSALRVLWRHSTLRSVLIAAFGSCAIVAATVVAKAMGLRVGDRLMGTAPSILLGIATVSNAVIQAQATLLRAQKREPFLTVSLVSAGCVIVLAPWLTALYGAMGTVVAYTCSTLAALPVAGVIFASESRALYAGRATSWAAP